MVFELTDSLINYKIDQEQDILKGLRNLLIGYQEGNLILIASDEFCEFYFDRVGDEYKRELRYIYKHNSFNYDVNWYTKVVLDQADVTKHEISISFFTKTSSIQPTLLVGENMDDAHFYYKLVSYYYPQENIKCRKDYGGGSSSFDKLENIINNERSFCLGIFDSDIRYPGCPDGGTYKKVWDIYKNSEVNIFVEKLEVHEVENLIPFSFLIKNTKAPSTRKFLENLRKKKMLENIMPYYDIKAGISRKQINSDRNYYNFAETIYDALVTKAKKGTFEKSIGNYKDDHLIFPPIQPSILTKFVQSKSTFDEYTSYLTSIWDHLAKLIYTFVCTRGDNPIS